MGSETLRREQELTRRPRTADFDITFGGPDRVTLGWFVPVPEVFRTSLDIRWTERKGKSSGGWTQGTPPRYSFRVGDVLYDPPAMRSMNWGEALKVCRRMVKVMAAVGDMDTDRGRIKEGKLTFIVWTGPPFTPDRGEIFTGTQREFVAYLRTGVPPEHQPGTMVDRPVTPGLHILLEYGDMQGEVTERTVTPYSITSLGDRDYLFAYCHRRKEKRQFRIDRIRQAIDMTTGEVCDGGEGVAGAAVKAWLAVHTSAAQAAGLVPEGTDDGVLADAEE